MQYKINNKDLKVYPELVEGFSIKYMILTAHILLGGAIGSKLNSPAVTVALSIAGHYVLDSFPHLEYDISDLKKIQFSKKFLIAAFKIILDFAAGFSLLFLLARNSPAKLMIFLGALAALIPDFFLFLSWYWPEQPVLKIFRRIHNACHSPKKISSLKWLGLTVETSLVIAAISFLLR